MANEYQGYSNTDWQRSATTTLAKHFRDEEKATLRNYQILALLESNGRVSYNNGGRGFDWPVKYKNHRIEGNDGTTTRSFAAVAQNKIAHLEYRGYQVTDSISTKEKLENRGPEAIIDVVANMGNNLMESMKQGLGAEPFVDGNAAGNEKSWHGLESMFAINGTLNISAGTQRAANALDKVGYPNDTYAGLSTVLGNYGGENESGIVWPLGIADPQYDFWAPLVVNYTSSAFGGAADTWAAQGDEAMRYAIIHGQRNATLDGQITNVIVDRNLYNDFLNLIDAKEQIRISRGEPTGLVALGFKNVVEFDGVQVSWDVAVPTNVGYGLNWRNIELLSMHPQLFVPEGPFYDEYTQTHNAVLSTLSNFRMKSPRNFFKLAALA